MIGKQTTEIKQDERYLNQNQEHQLENTYSDYQSIGQKCRLTRRMKKILSDTSKSKNDKCAICLNNFQNDYARLQCNHKFCYICMIRWWKSHQSCPYCREPFTFILNSKGNKITRDKISFKSLQSSNTEFIPHCQFCWGQIENHQEMRICWKCRSIYCHLRCLNFKCRRWLCNQCFDDEQYSSEEYIRTPITHLKHGNNKYYKIKSKK